MPVTAVVTFIVIVCALTAVAEPLSRRTRLPLPAVLVLIGIVAGQVVEVADFDTGFRHYHFNEIVLVALLPPLIFQASLELDLRNLRPDAGLVGAFAVVGLVICAAVIAVALYYGVDHAQGFPWTAALLAGALLAASDPDVVLPALRRAKASRRAIAILQGEGLFNDTGAAILFSVLLSFALAGGGSIDGLTVAIRIATLVVAGCVIGAALAVLAFMVLSGVRSDAGRSMLTVGLAYGSYLVGNTAGASGVVATLAAALVIRRLAPRSSSTQTLSDIASTWGALAYASRAVIFLLVGFAVTASMFTQRRIAMLIGIAAVILARVVMVYALTGARNLLYPSTAIGLRDQTLLAVAGTRGGVTLVLALALPTSLPYWWTIQSIAFGVVLFTLLMQMPLTHTLVHRLQRPRPID